MPRSVTNACLVAELHEALFDHRVGERHRQRAGKMIVAGSPEAQRRILRSGAEFPSRRCSIGRDTHDALHHIGDVGRCDPMVAMASLFHRCQQLRIGEPRQMAACRLRRDAGDGRKFRSGQRPAVEKSVHHRSSGRVADKGGNLRETRLAGHRSCPLRFGLTIAS